MPEFKDTRFMTAAEKAKVLKQWEAFLKSGCERQYFTEGLYHHLIQHCHFIAHYDRAGFFDTYFVEPEDTVHFLTQFDDSKGEPRSIEYGMAWLGNDDYTDLNTAMCKMAAPYIPQLVAFARAGQQDKDVLRARALLARHGLKAEIRKVSP